MSGEVLVARDVTFAYPNRVGPVIECLSLAVGLSEIVAVRGVSGSGKSTLLYLLGLFLRPEAGTISVGGVETSRLADDARSRIRAHCIGFVFQDACLQHGVTIEESVAEGALYAGVPYAAAISRARSLLADFGLATVGTHTPAQVSGGGGPAGGPVSCVDPRSVRRSRRRANRQSRSTERRPGDDGTSPRG